MTQLPSFTAECSACAALCCVAMAFDRGEEFAIDKPARTPCPNLTADFSCSIHHALESKGFGGCARYDCLGAGQRVTQDLFFGRNWRDDPALLAPMATAFAALRQVHRDLELLLAARSLPLPADLAATRAALITAYAPPGGWTPASLDRFAASDLPRRTKALLRALRAHV